MNLCFILYMWNDKLQKKIKKIVDKQDDLSFFIKVLADKQQFWYACVWMCLFTEQYFKVNPAQDLEIYFKKADKMIASMPDLFKDRVFMQAHGLLWKYGFKQFFENIHHVVQIAGLVEQQSNRKN